MIRHLLHLLAAIIITLSASAQASWTATAHDFGAFSEDLGTVYCTFSLVNTSSQPIAILSARANCGCTRPEYSTAPIAPGDTATIRVGFDAVGRPGRFQKQIVVDCSADPLRTRLTISGTVIGAANTLATRFPIQAGAIRLRTLTIPYGKVIHGTTPGQYIEAYNTTPDTIRPTIIHTPSYISSSIQPPVVPPGEQFIVSTILYTTRTPEWGPVTDSILVAPRPGDNPVKIETVAIVAEDFSHLTDTQLAEAPQLDTSTTALDLRTISRSSSPARHSFDIINRGRSTLVVRRISCTDPAVSNISIKNTRIKPGKKTSVTVTIDPALIPSSAELLNARVNIIANDPANPTTTVRVVAEVK
ncbi:MAG: DUF1573 domain-containing protein [Duncaniella sp.]|nr:DUF1573 domain-containing protein [Duncaniella sp.]